MQISGGLSLLVHLRMTGSFHLDMEGRRSDSHDRVVLRLSDGRALHFHDPRKFGRWYLVDDPARVVGHLGPEPLGREFSAAGLAVALRSRRRMLKPLLLDQTFVAGLGNIYVDESLWEARLHPCRLSATITPAEARRLHAAIRLVLRKGIANMGTTLGSGEANFYSVGRRRGRNRDALRVFRRTGEPCLRCGAVIKRVVVGQRSTHFCPTCQVQR
jgi:formamidopyrimidine-DNA glycosylase